LHEGNITIPYGGDEDKIPKEHAKIVAAKYIYNCACHGAFCGGKGKEHSHQSDNKMANKEVPFVE
jgi:hypothetical protein